MGTIIGKGRSSITVSGPAVEELDRGLRTMLGPVLEFMQQGAEEILELDIQNNWPVKTGKSLRAWRIQTHLNPGEFKAGVALINDVEYSRYIKSTKVGKRADATRVRSPLQAHVRKPVRSAKKTLKKELPRILAKHLESEVFNG